jgi:hypothetical protein
MLCETCKNVLYKRVAIVSVVAATVLVVAGGIAAAREAGGRAAHGSVHPSLSAAAVRSRPRLFSLPALRARHRAQIRRIRRAHDPKPKVASRATISLYEHTTKQSVFRRQGCRAATRGATGVVILDFGKPAYNGHTYGTILFSGAFAGNRAITRAMLGYASGYNRCLPRGSSDRIALARGTSNYHPNVPSAYRAGKKWARETMALQHLLRERRLDAHVVSAAADDVEPAWDKTFWRTRDFYRGYAAARTGHLLYNYGSLDGGIVTGYWNVHQAFFVTGGMRYARAIPEIYSRTMARQWAALAQVARHRYHRPVKFAGVMTEHTSANHGMKPRDAHRVLVRELAALGGAGDVPAAYTNINSPQ